MTQLVVCGGGGVGGGDRQLSVLVSWSACAQLSPSYHGVWQMQGFYGWKSASMCQEYISTSRPAVMHAAQTLGSFDFGRLLLRRRSWIFRILWWRRMRKCVRQPEYLFSGPSTVPNSTFNKGLSQPCLMSLVYKLTMWLSKFVSSPTPWNCELLECNFNMYAYI
jgi:hypothetical protein